MNATSPVLRVGIWTCIILLILLAAALFVRGMGRVSDVRTPGSSGSLHVGDSLPNVTLSTLTGKPVSLRAYEGHPVWINFFATWCVPCKAELPEIERRYKARGANGLVVFGVDQQESPVAVESFTKHFGVTYPIAIDPGGAAVAFDLHTIPLSVFVDPHGVVRYIRIGQMQPADMDDALKTILPNG
jgi:peroxiredoxin